MGQTKATLMPFTGIQSEKKRALDRADDKLLLNEMAASQFLLSISHSTSQNCINLFVLHNFYGCSHYSDWQAWFLCLLIAPSLQFLAPVHNFDHCPISFSCSPVWFTTSLYVLHDELSCFSMPSQFYISQNLMSKH